MADTIINSFCGNKRNDKFMYIGIVAGILILFVSIVMNTPGMGTAVLCSVVCYLQLNGNREILKIYDKYLEIKVTRIAPLMLIARDDINTVRRDSKKIVITLNNQQKKIIPLAFFQEAERENVAQELEKYGEGK